MTDPHDCGFFEWHGPAPAEGAEWTPCVGCGTPQALPPPPMFWSDDVWRFLMEHHPKEVTLTTDPDEDGATSEFTVAISGGLFATLMIKVSDLMKRSNTTLISDWELSELKERAGVPAHWEPGRPLP